VWMYATLGITLGFAATVQPGPFLTYIISQALKNGWKRTLPAAFAPLLSDVPIAGFVLLVLSSMPAWLEQVLHLAGGFFLLYLAYGALQTWRNFHVEDEVSLNAEAQGVLKAATVNLLNPGPYLGWSLLLGPLLLKGWRETPLNGIALLTGFLGTMVASLIGIIVLFSVARSLGGRVNRALIGLTALALAGFGLYQLWLAMRQF